MPAHNSAPGESPHPHPLPAVAARGDKIGWHVPGVKEGCWLGQVDAARGAESEPARPPAPWAGRLSSPAPSAAGCCPGAVAAALAAAVAGEGAGVCARPEPLQHLCIKMCSSLSQAPLTGWLLSSANAGALEMTSSAPSTRSRPHPPGFTSFAVI